MPLDFWRSRNILCSWLFCNYLIPLVLHIILHLNLDHSLLAYATKLFGCDCTWESSAGFGYVSPIFGSQEQLSGTSSGFDYSPPFLAFCTKVNSLCVVHGWCLLKMPIHLRAIPAVLGHIYILFRKIYFHFLLFQMPLISLTPNVLMVAPSYANKVVQSESMFFKAFPVKSNTAGLNLLKTKIAILPLYYVLFHYFLYLLVLYILWCRLVIFVSVVYCVLLLLCVWPCR